MPTNNLIQKLRMKNNEGIRFAYDEEGDTLEIFFGENEPATGVEITDDILLRLNKAAGRAISLTIHHFSILAEQTEYGPRSFALENIDTLPDELREIVLRVITTPPTNQFLKISYFQDSPTKCVPLTYIETSCFAAAA
ncbi:MAG: DUF2283 domain-containing protein [Desulfatirhabdiaceae bacterium]